MALLLFGCLFLFAQLTTQSLLDPPNPPTTGAFFSGVYRNMFVEAGIDASSVNNRINQTWQQIFYGDPSNQALFYPTSDGSMAYIWSVDSNDVRSEGMSYGMMIAVQLNHQKEFDMLWKWAKTYMQHTDPTDPRYGYFSWHCQTNGNVMDQNPASDGETWFVTALLFAATRWGDKGTWNYTAEANLILHEMIHKEDQAPVDSVMNMFNTQNSQVVFTPYASAATYTDPSYHTPAFYYIWSIKAQESTDFWKGTITAARNYFPTTANGNTGLMPDYSDFNGAPYGSGQNFAYDAWRCGQHVAVDYAWFAADPWQITQSNKLLEFFHGPGGGIGKYGNQYTLSGQELDTDHSPGLVAMNAVACLASNDIIAWDFINEFWNTSIPTGQYRYYDGMLYFIGLLHVSGNFRAYV